MPVFALANAAVPISLDGLTHPVTNAVALGLVLGKPLGIILVSVLVVRLGLGNLPEGVSWLMLAGAGSLAGIGFTMALFTAGLAFEANHLSTVTAEFSWDQCRGIPGKNSCRLTR
jgi:Na+:H+ antiporter, NhaA family